MDGWIADSLLGEIYSSLFKSVCVTVSEGNFYCHRFIGHLLFLCKLAILLHLFLFVRLFGGGFLHGGTGGLWTKVSVDCGGQLPSDLRNWETKGFHLHIHKCPISPTLCSAHLPLAGTLCSSSPSANKCSCALHVLCHAGRLFNWTYSSSCLNHDFVYFSTGCWGERGEKERTSTTFIAF